MVWGDTSLRPLAPADADLYIGIYTDARLMDQVCVPLTVVAAERAFAAALKANADPGARARYWLMADRISATPTGVLGVLVSEHEKLGLQGEVGAIVLGDWQGRGQAAAAISALARWAFGLSPIARLHTCHGGNNDSAAGLMRKLGFVRVANGPTRDLHPCCWELRREHGLRFVTDRLGSETDSGLAERSIQ